MSNRVSSMILLCEDQAQERLIKAYLRRCGLQTDSPVVRSIVASRMVQGGNVHWVLNRFPEQLQVCRQRQSRAATLLIVMIDATDLRWKPAGVNFTSG